MVLCCAVCRIVEVNRQQPVGGSRKPAGESQQVEDGCQHPGVLAMPNLAVGVFGILVFGGCLPFVF